VSSIGDELIVKTVDAFGVGTMLTQHLGSSNFILGIDSGAVEALSSWSMIAF